MEQHSLLLAYSIYDILLKKIKSSTQEVKKGDEYIKILSDVLLANMNIEVYSKLSIDYKNNIAEMLADKLVKLYVGGKQYSCKEIDGYWQIYAVIFPPTFGNKEILLGTISGVLIEINKYLNFPLEWSSLRNQNNLFFKRLPRDLFNMVGSYCMDEDITTLTPKIR